MKILIIGGDGFVGWPVSLRLSMEGHRVTVIDNFSRRRIDEELGCNSLTPIRLMSERVESWNKLVGKKIVFKRVDVARNYCGLLDVLKKVKPEVIVHLAEQRSAPYSMKTPDLKRYSVSNNISATHNILCSIVESGLDIHLVHIGSTGVYGYNGNDCVIPEGYLSFYNIKDSRSELMEDLFPMRPGSIYHMTKTMDSMMFKFYSSNDRIRITDLHQGIIWGVQTKHTSIDPSVYNRFDYCGDYGTVLNRFIVQGVIGGPITPYGKGKQTRAFIHIENSTDCVVLAINNPPERGDRTKIFNQTTEQLCIADLAKIVSDMTGSEVKHVPNPRIENEENTLQLENKQFLNLGLNPIPVNSKGLKEVIALAEDYKDRIDVSKIPCTSSWRNDICLPTEDS